MGIEKIGSLTEPNLEKILTLKPDLILGHQAVHGAIYKRLSQIAPTILVEDHGDWKENLKLCAKALGKADSAEQLMDDYYARLDKFKAQMGERLNQTEVSVVRMYPDAISIYLKNSFSGTILDDAGLPRPPAQDRDLGSPKLIQKRISKERIREADGNVMFVWTYGQNAEIAQAAETKVEKLKADPLWSKLNVVQQNQVYQVPSCWGGDGPLAANLVIDDLFKYLVGAK